MGKIKQIFGSIDRTFLIRSYVISFSFSLIAGTILTLTSRNYMDYDEPTGILILLFLNAFFYPFARYIYFKIRYPITDFYDELVPYEKLWYTRSEVEDRLWRKFIGFIILYSFTLFIAPIGIIYILVKNRK